MEDFEKELKQAFLKEAQHPTADGTECISLNTLGRYIDNALSDEETLKVQQHTGSCAHCMKRLIELRDTLSMVRQAESGLEKDLDKISKQEGSGVSRVYEWMKGVFQSRTFVYAFSAAVLLIVFASLISKQSHKSVIPDYVVKLKALNADGQVINTGVGFLESPNGIVIAKLADVSGATSIDVDVNNNVYKGDEVVGIDRNKGLVALKINGIDLPYARFSNSQVGQKVIAISKSFKTVDGYIENFKAIKITSLNKEISLLEITLSKPGDYDLIVNSRGDVVGVSPIQIDGKYMAFESNRVQDMTHLNLTLSQVTYTTSIDATRDYMNGMLAISANKSELAIKYLEHSLEYDPNNDNARLELADLYYKKGEEDKSIDQYKKLLQHTPDNTDALLLLGSSYEDIGKYDLAVDAYKKGLAVHPEDTDLLYNLGQLYIIQGNNKDAQVIADRLKSLKPALAKELEALIHRIPLKDNKSRSSP